MVKLKEERVYAVCKRGIDVFLSLLLLAFLAPLFYLIALGVRLSSPGPALFCQVRMGKGLEPFLLYKFRTMAQNAPRECPTAAFVSPTRHITRFGAFLRKTSLDELPQLWNVLRGDMSLLGPRPVLLAETDLIAARAVCGAYRVRPGMSGLSQVLGRDLLNNEEKAALDGVYARRLSLRADLRLLWATGVAVLFHRGVKEGK